MNNCKSKKRGPLTYQFSDSEGTPGYLVYKARISKGYTQEELSESSGVSAVTINRIERNKCRPHRIIIESVLEVLEIPLEEYEKVSLSYYSSIEENKDSSTEPY